MKRCISIVIAMLSIIGCTVENSQMTDINLMAQTVPYKDETTRSSITCSDTHVSGLSLALYFDGSLVYEQYFDDTESMSLEMVIGRQYSIYAVANSGDVSFPSSESSIASLSLHQKSLDVISSDGLPMAWHGDWRAYYGGTLTIPLVRLVARYDISIDASALEGTFSVSSLELKNAASVIYPFAESSKAESTCEVDDGDFAVASDLAKICSGDAVSYYILENRQGTSSTLSCNTDPWAKTPSNSGVLGDVATFVEISGLYICNGLVSDLKYRFYLGKDELKNFDIVRNTACTITLVLSDDGMLRNSWKVERGIKEDRRTIAFDPSSLEFWDSSPLTSSIVTTDGISVNTAIAYSSPVGEGLSEAGLTFSHDASTRKVTVSTDGLATADCSAYIDVSTADGLKSARLPIIVHPPITKRYEITLTPSSEDSPTLRTGKSNTFSVRLYTHLYRGENLVTSDSAGTVIDNCECLWSIEGTGASINSSGVLTAGSSKGSVTVTARLKSDTSISCSTVISIIENGIGYDTGWTDGGHINL